MTGKVKKEMALNLQFYYAARNGDTKGVRLSLLRGADLHFASDAVGAR